MALDLGPCAIFYGSAGSEEDIGKSHGGVKVNFSQDVADLMSDQYGTQPEDQVITGHSAMIAIPMADYSLDNFARALHKTVGALNGGHGVKGDGVVGTKMSTYENSLILKKYVDGSVSTDEDDWMTFPAAAPMGDPEVNFDGTNQRVIQTNFRAFPDSSDVLYYLGDSDAAESGT